MFRLRTSGRGFADQLRQERNTVDVGGSGGAGGLGDGRQYVGKITEMLADAPRRDGAGPAHDERHPQPAFVQIPFMTAELDAGARVLVRRVNAAGMFARREVVGPAVVAAEEDPGFIVESQFVEQRQHLADLTIDHRHHRRVPPRRLGPRTVAILGPGRIPVRNVEVAVRRRVRKVGEERLASMFANELQRGFVNHVLRIRSAVAAAAVARQRNLLAVENQIRGIVRVRMHLIVVAEKDVEAVLLRNAGRVASSAAPFAEAAGRIAALLQHRSDRRLFSPQRSSAAVDAHRGMTRMLAGEQAAARRRTNGRARQQVREAGAFGRQPVDVRRAKVRVPHIAGLVVTQLVDDEVNDVGLRFRGRGSTVKSAGRDQKRTANDDRHRNKLRELRMRGADRGVATAQR